VATVKPELGFGIKILVRWVSSPQHPIKRMVEMKNISLKERGYTLVEVMVAFGILVVFFLAISGLEVAALHSVFFISKKQASEFVVDTLIDQIRAKGITSDKQPDKKRKGTTYISDIPYRWEIDTSDTGDKKNMSKYLKKVNITVTWQESEGTGRLVRETVVVLPCVADPSPTPSPSKSP